MSMHDPIADLLTRMRNAQMMGIKMVDVPHSRIKCDILQVLQDEGYIEGFVVEENNAKKDIKITLKYHQGRRVIETIKRVSKPSLRIYKKHKELPLVRGGLGLIVVSTSQGVMSASKAKTNGLGGEILCTVE